METLKSLEFQSKIDNIKNQILKLNEQIFDLNNQLHQVNLDKVQYEHDLEVAVQDAVVAKAAYDAQQAKEQAIKNATRDQYLYRARRG